MTELSAQELRRYNRHLILPEIGVAGQKRLKSSSVLLVGTGGLGSPAAMYLAAAGVGRLGIVDFDVVDESNLHRQIIHGQSNLGEKKVESAKKRLLDINPCIEVVTYDAKLTSENAKAIINDFDIVADGTDNFPTRYLVNDACQLLGKPNVYASIFRFEGQVSVFDARKGPCYRCLFKEPPPAGMVPSCAEGGVLGILPGIVGTLQANEVIKLILGIGDPLIGRLLSFNALTMAFFDLSIQKDPNCALCGPNRSVCNLIDYEQFCGMPAHENLDITPKELAALLSQGRIKLIDVREPDEWEICRIDGATLMPLSQFTQNYSQLPNDEEIVLYCKMGGRSARALKFLQDRGYTRLRNLNGGIIAWGQQIDTSISPY